jgi:uncharacterized membrane protein HdeD (DUF308 family)
MWHQLVGGLPIVVVGAIAVVAGTVILLLPSPSLRTIGIVVGAALLASALVEAVGLLRHPERGKRADRALAAVALAGAGAVVLLWPTISQLALLYAVGASAVVLGVAEVAALSTRPGTVRERWLGAALGIVAFVFGIAMIAHPDSSLTTVINLLGVYLIVIGALRLLQAAEAWHRRRAASQA